LHSNVLPGFDEVNWNVAVEEFARLGGALVIVVAGGSVAMVQVLAAGVGSGDRTCASSG
jgi:hypothetical protein